MDFSSMRKTNGTPGLLRSDESNASRQKNNLSVTWAPNLIRPRSKGGDRNDAEEDEDVLAEYKSRAARARGTVVSPGMFSTDNFDFSDEEEDEEDEKKAEFPAKSRARGTVVGPGMLKVSTDDFDDSDEDDEEVLALCNTREF